jgi:hypothetical protein
MSSKTGKGAKKLSQPVVQPRQKVHGDINGKLNGSDEDTDGDNGIDNINLEVEKKENVANANSTNIKGADNNDVDRLANMMMAALTTALAQMKQQENIKSNNNNNDITTIAEEDDHIPSTKASSSSGLKHKKIPPKFNGKRTNLAEYKTWKQQVQRYLRYYNVKDEDTHNVLCDCLIGEALTWFSSYSDAHPEITSHTYDDLMKILDKEYFDPLSVNKYLYEYQQMKALPNETISELVVRINNLAIQAGITLRDDQEKKNKLYSLLPTIIQKKTLVHYILRQLHMNNL